MPCLQWSTSHAVFVTEIDDEHKEIFLAVGHVQERLRVEQRRQPEGDGADDQHLAGRQRPVAARPLGRRP